MSGNEIADLLPDRLAVRARLTPFAPEHAARVVRWIADDNELFHLAPKTPPPITVAKVLSWSEDRDDPRLLYMNDSPEPVAYGELHYMPGSRTHLWLGHLLVAPAHRGAGHGCRLTRRLLDEAFTRRRARRVSLVVFPDNPAAIRCYRRAGLVHAGEQEKFFETTRQRHRMIAMTIDRARFRKLPRIYASA